MSSEITTHNDLVNQVKSNQELSELLLKSKHYSKMGPEGIFAIVEKARSIGVNPLDALNGGMFFVQGKVELTAQLMNHLIREAKHSITQDPTSSPDCCVLRGKRCDTGDSWVASFSIKDAQTAGIYRNQWLKYPQDMLFARALSRLARQLFPDVVRGCYVQGEIAEAVEVENMKKLEAISNTITQEQYLCLADALEGKDELKQKILDFMKSKFSVDHLSLMPQSMYDYAIKRAKEWMQVIPEMENK